MKKLLLILFFPILAQAQFNFPRLSIDTLKARTNLIRIKDSVQFNSFVQMGFMSFAPTEIAGYGHIYVKSDSTINWRTLGYTHNLDSVTTAGNLSGTGVGIYKSRSGVQEQFKRIVHDPTTTVTDMTDSVKIAVDTTVISTRATSFRASLSGNTPQTDSIRLSTDATILGTQSGHNITLKVDTTVLQTRATRFKWSVTGQTPQNDSLRMIPTTNQVNISQVGHTATFSLPQDIATTSSPLFSNLTTGGNVEVGSDLILDAFSNALLYSNSGNVVGGIADVATGQVITSQGVGIIPAWSASPSLTGLTLSGLTPAKSIWFSGTGGLATSDANILQWDNSQKFLRLGSNSTKQFLVDVRGAAGDISIFAKTDSVNTGFTPFAIGFQDTISTGSLHTRASIAFKELGSSKSGMSFFVAKDGSSSTYAVAGFHPEGLSIGKFNTGNIQPNVSLDVQGAIANRDSTFAQWSADQNDVDIGWMGSIRVTEDSNRNVTGFKWGYQGRILILKNVGASNLTMKHQNSGSTAGNRLINASAGDRVVGASQSITYQYDSTSTAWREIGTTGKWDYLSGGTGTVSYSTNGVVVAGTSAFSTSSSLTFDGNNLNITTSGTALTGVASAGNNLTMILNTTTASKQDILSFRDAGTTKFNLFKQTDNSLQLFHNALGLTTFRVDPTTGDWAFGKSQQTSWDTNGVFKKIEGVTAPTTEHWKFPMFSDTVSRSGQTATIGATNLNNTATNGVYRVSYYVYTTTAGTSGTVSITISWNDGAAESVTSANLTFGVLGAFVQGTTMLEVTNSTAATWATTVTSAIGSPVYKVDVLAERLW